MTIDAPSQVPEAMNDSVRLSRRALAQLLKYHPSTVYEVLKRPDAPQPDEAMHYDMEEATNYLQANVRNSPKGGGSEVVELKQQKLSLEIAKLKRVEEERAGKFVSVEEIQEGVEQLAMQQRALLRQLFEHELPSKCRGKTVEEIRQLIVEAMDEFDRAFREGGAKLSPQPDEPNGKTGTQ